MPRWDDMTEEERERYVNQDVVKRNRREILCPSERFAQRSEAAAADGCGFAELFSGVGYLPQDSVLHRLMDPLSLEFLRMYYGEKKTLEQIVEASQVKYDVDGRTVMSKRFNINTIWRRLLSARAALREALGEDVLQGLKDLRSNQ